MHRNSLIMFNEYASKYLAHGRKVLEIGPDGCPSTFQEFMHQRWDTLDIRQQDGLTYLAKSEYQFPVADSEFDVVFSASVIEHVRQIWVWIKELARVCRAGGLVITICPTSWPYHEAPIDCWRIYPEGMRALYESAGLEVELCVCESLEPAPLNWAIPGRSLAHVKESGLRKIYERNLASEGPCEVAFDTVCVGIKR